MLWEIDPGEINPAFSRWALERKLELIGLKVREARAVEGEVRRFWRDLRGFGLDRARLRAGQRALVLGLRAVFLR